MASIFFFLIILFIDDLLLQCRNYVRSQRKNSDQLSEHYIVAKQDPAKNTWNEIPVSTKTNWKTG